MIVKEENIGVKLSNEFYKTLREELKKKENVIIDFSSVKGIDLSIVQILTAAGREAKSMGKTVQLKAPSENVKNLLQICGLKI